MREIVLDTETTGLDPFTGDRIVEIGAVELLNHMPTGEVYHQYINPERDMPAGAFAVHGLSAEFLLDKPVFTTVAKEFLDFIQDSRLIIHNAAFDMKFLNAELDWSSHPQIPLRQSLDTLAIARKKFAGAQNSLDALCRRFGIDNSNRTLHGALLDSQILAEVYLELIGGRQPDFALKVVQNTGRNTLSGDYIPQKRPEAMPSRITQEESAAHAEFINELGGEALWKR